jgi:hypothetical protein
VPAPFPTITRTRTYRCCPVCGRLRIGAAAIGWPVEAALCPHCSKIARALLAHGIDSLSPEEQAS